MAVVAETASDSVANSKAAPNSIGAASEPAAALQPPIQRTQQWSAAERRAQLQELLDCGLVTQEEIDGVAAMAAANGATAVTTVSGVEVQATSPGAPMGSPADEQSSALSFMSTMDGMMAVGVVEAEAGHASSRLEPGGALQTAQGAESRLPSTLSPALAQAFKAFDLLDPTTLSPEEKSKATGAVMAGTLVLFPLLYFKFGFLGDLAFSTFFGGGTAGYAALRNDVIGIFVRDVIGSTANLAAVNVLRTTEELNEEYDLAKSAQERLQRQLEQLIALKDKTSKER